MNILFSYKKGEVLPIYWLFKVLELFCFIWKYLISKNISFSAFIIIIFCSRRHKARPWWLYILQCPCWKSLVLWGLEYNTCMFCGYFDCEWWINIFSDKQSQSINWFYPLWFRACVSLSSSLPYSARLCQLYPSP